MIKIATSLDTAPQNVILKPDYKKLPATVPTAFAAYTAKADTDMKLVVTATGTNTSGIFSVGLESSLFDACVNSPSTATSTSTASTATSTAKHKSGVVSSKHTGSLSGALISVLGFVVIGICC